MKDEHATSLGEKLRARVLSHVPEQAVNAVTLMGKTVDQIRKGITKGMVGLGNMQNYPMATDAESVTGTATNRYTTPQGVQKFIEGAFSRIRGDEGDMIYLDDVGFDSFIPGKSLSFLSVVTTDAELQTMLNVQEKMADVFNSWKKISRGNWRVTQAEKEALGYTDNAVPDDLAGFTYDPATDKIKNARDTFSLVGFISPFGYENYVLDVILRSDSTWQNDPLGLIVGYVTDPDGTTHTLSVMRNPWPGYGAPGAVTVHVDYNTYAPILIKAQREGLLWVDGQPATGGMLPPPPQPYAVKPWSLATNGTRLKVTRAGDTFTVETTEYDGTTLMDAAKFTFTLNDHPSLARFKGPSKYGYAAISQDNAVWDVQTRPGARQTIVDIRDKSVREWDGNQWVVKTDAWGQYIKPNRFYYNRTTKRLYYAENETTLLSIL